MPEIMPVPNSPMLEVETQQGKMGILSDLHLGTSTAWRKQGIIVSKHDENTPLIELITQHHLKRLLLLGDLKASNYSYNKWEERALVNFVNSIKIPVEIIKGNHDAGIENISHPLIRIHPELIHLERTKLGLTIGFGHGHSIPKQLIQSVDVLVLGHLHPCVLIKDEIGASWIIKAWLFGKIELDQREIKVIILPAANPLIRGLPVNSSKEELEEIKIIIGKERFPIDSFTVMTPELTTLGTIEDLLLHQSQ